MMQWQWAEESRTYGSYGNPNQWAVGGGIDSLARESAQNSNDAKIEGADPELRFTFIPLEGERRSDFESALGWDDLRRHLRAMTKSQQVVNASLKDGLDHLDSTDQLVLLRIEDRGCKGLTGPEFTEAELEEDAYGNFIKLCRLDLFSGKEQAAGGSFGLGKAVYWRFSRVQTVLFGSNLFEPWNGKAAKRLFGVNVGTVHTLDGVRYNGRGYFGRRDAEGDVESVFADDALTESLLLGRPENVTGTTALIVGFWDPSQPEQLLDESALSLEAAVEEAFWPLITRGGMRFVVDVEDGAVDRAVEVKPDRTLTELVHALRTYDSDGAGDSLENLGDVVVRDIPIEVPRRKLEPVHDSFTHSAKLVVTLSDEQQDPLENKVCLFRGPGMVVETIDEQFPNIRYHAMLLAGKAVSLVDHNLERTRADDFLRIAEPPSHDQWIPTRSGLQTSLSSYYSPPFLPNLRQIKDDVKQTLRDIFNVVPTADDKPPQQLVRYLRLLSEGSGPDPTERVGKPRLDLTNWRVEDGRWKVDVKATMKNRPEGWRFRAVPQFVGADGETVAVRWIPGSVSALDGCDVDEDWIVVEGNQTGRVLRASFRAESDPESHPIPAERSAFDVRAESPGAADIGAAS